MNPCEGLHSLPFKKGEKSMATLQQVVSQNQSLLGANFEHLGKSGGIYLSYEQGAGWSVKKFDGCCGFVKLALRWLGFYASTHLSTIKAEIQKEGHVIPALQAKINECWNRQKGIELSPTVAATPVQAPGALPLVNEPQRRFVPNLDQPNRLGEFIGSTHISVMEGDLLNVSHVKAIVNAANEACLGGGGIDGAIHRAAGPALLAECEQLPLIRPNVRCEVGRAVITRSGLLEERAEPNKVERIIHAVGPRYNAANPVESAALLRQTYISALVTARTNGIRSVAFPAISTGLFGYPALEASRISTQTIEAYVLQHPGCFDEIALVFFGEDAYHQGVQGWNGVDHPGIRDHLGWA
jgi:O-acetyl-ADP-ribose deacetylase (regulator of RNase III)